MRLKDNKLPKCPECGDIENDGVCARAIKGGKAVEIYCRIHQIDMGILKGECQNCLPWMRRAYMRFRTSPNNDNLFMYCLKHYDIDPRPDGMSHEKFDELCKEQLL